ncbi:MAG: hypothetical protein V3W04_00805 [Gammaproteobacteria bacterium]
MNFSITAIIISLVIIFSLVVTVNAFKYTDPFGVGKKKAREILPEVAKKMGLEYLQPNDSDEFGGLTGKYKGFQVDVSPNDTSVIDVELNKIVKIHLSDDKPSRSHLNEGMDTFDFNNKSANAFFTTRFSNSGSIERLKNSQEIARFVDAFNGSWGSEISRFDYSNGILHVRFKYGSDSYIPANDIEPMINNLITFAEILEAF